MARLPNPDPGMGDWMDGIEDRLKALEGRSAFYGTGVHPNGEQGLDSDNYVAGESGFSLRGGDGFLEVNDIELRGGIIGNDALSNPVAAGFIYDYLSGFAVPAGSLANIRSTLIPVPAGFTGAIVSVAARCYALNSTAGLDYLYCQANINGYNGLALPTPASGSNGSAINVSPFAITLSGLTPGSNINVQIAVGAAFGAWAANASNQADVAGSVIWFR